MKEGIAVKTWSNENFRSYQLSPFYYCAIEQFSISIKHKLAAESEIGPLELIYKRKRDDIGR